MPVQNSSHNEEPFSQLSRSSRRHSNFENPNFKAPLQSIMRTLHLRTLGLPQWNHFWQSSLTFSIIKGKALIHFDLQLRCSHADRTRGTNRRLTKCLRVEKFKLAEQLELKSWEMPKNIREPSNVNWDALTGGRICSPREISCVRQEKGSLQGLKFKLLKHNLETVHLNDKKFRV